MRSIEPRDSGSRERSGLQLLRDPLFGGLFWGKLVSAAGVWVHGIVAAIVVFDATGSAFAVGLVSIAQFVPQILLTPMSGTWADRGHAWGQMIAGRTICLLGSAFLVPWFLLVGQLDGWKGAWPVLGASVVVGLGFVVGGPAQQSVIPLLVTPAELPTAMTLNTAPMTFARVAGPAMGAVLADRLGAWEAFAFAALTHLAFVAILLCMRIPSGDPRPSGTDYSVRAAVRFAIHRRSIAIALVAVAATGMGSEPSITLAPALAHDLGGGSPLVGMVTSSFGAGAAAGLITAGATRKRTSLAVLARAGLTCMAAGMTLVAAIDRVPIALLGLSLAGLGFTWAMSSLGTLVQIETPSILRGRIMALWMVAFIGSRPVAASVLGAVADQWSVRPAIAMMAALLAVAAVMCRPSRLFAPSGHVLD